MSLESDLQVARSLIRQLQGALGGKTTRCGTDTVSFAGGSASSGVKTVTHGLGTTPTVVQVTCITGGPAIAAYQAFNYTSTTFQVAATFVEGSTGAATQSFAWTATG